MQGWKKTTKKWNEMWSKRQEKEHIYVWKKSINIQDTVTQIIFIAEQRMQQISIFSLHAEAVHIFSYVFIEFDIVRSNLLTFQVIFISTENKSIIGKQFYSFLGKNLFENLLNSLFKIAYHIRNTKFC